MKLDIYSFLKKHTNLIEDIQLSQDTDQRQAIVFLKHNAVFEGKEYCFFSEFFIVEESLSYLSRDDFYNSIFIQTKILDENNKKINLSKSNLNHLIKSSIKHFIFHFYDKLFIEWRNFDSSEDYLEAYSFTDRKPAFFINDIVFLNLFLTTKKQKQFISRTLNKLLFENYLVDSNNIAQLLLKSENTKEFEEFLELNYSY